MYQLYKKNKQTLYTINCNSCIFYSRHLEPLFYQAISANETLPIGWLERIIHDTK